MKSTALAFSASTYVLGLALLPAVLAFAHGDDGTDHNHDDGNAGHEGAGQYEEEPDSYFGLQAHANVIYGHIALMTLAWVFILPIAVMLSIARSRYTIVTQFVFLAVNALALLLGTIYHAQTPDLYPGNAHHSIGWIATWIVSAHILVSLVGCIAGAVARRRGAAASHERQAFMALPTSEQPYRLSGESGQSTEVGSGSSSRRSDSVSTLAGDADSAHEEHRKEFDDEDDLEDLPLEEPARKGFLAVQAAKAVSSRVWKYVEFGYKVVDRIILPFGFVAFTTGIVTYARFFEGHGIYGGLAHWIKGGVFFWLGLFTLGRWAGSFADLGWAWNVRPKNTRKWRPSAEFIESALIFFYGITNIFLEHLGSSDGTWSLQDLEHVAITVLFIGGGLCGMLIESTWIRDLLNTTVHNVAHDSAFSEEERQALEPPASYEFSINPIPALVILLLGIMMGSHHQHSEISSMVHGQWGRLLLGASFARGLTYVIMYLKPPKSVLPSRPPTELLASFGLLSGGVIFMASSSDTIEAMTIYNLDAMFMYTVTLGCTGLVMAWEIIVLAVKGWAVRRERRSSF